MKLNNKYKITVEDESTLEKKFNVSTGVFPFFVSILAFLGLAVVISVFILAFTPLKTFLPGYLKESERVATEEQHLRLDSLLHIYEVNEAYLSGILMAFNPEEKDSVMQPEIAISHTLNVDSLLPTSNEERSFVEYIRERDKFNVAISSTLDAETLMFGNLNPGAVISQDSQDSYKAEIIIPIGGKIGTVAEGKVISVASSPRTAGGYEIIIQHPKGFLSKTGRLSNILVSPGEKVGAGQIIGGVSSESGRKSNIVSFELWHDGNRLLPSRYLNTGIKNL